MAWALLPARRADVAADRTRTINRLRAQLLQYFPALERVFDFSKSKGALTLLTGFRTPAALREIGMSCLVSWLEVHDVRSARRIATKAVEAAESQHTTVSGEKVAADMVLRIVRALKTLNSELAELDSLIEGRFRAHHQAAVITSLPGFGSLLGAEFIAATAAM
ncbi:hypothetical protein [Saccharopolyspora sp. 5N708]|uniref:hypothetical protein n=1 Tax=Saccharopolyspora sp. 5N708 TaxID=3457424 RepID=UPI003FD0469D